jgi:integrase
MDVTRQLRTDKLNKKGYAPIQVTICWDGHRVRKFTGQRCRPEHWDADGQRVRAVKGSYYAQINPFLDGIRNAAETAQFNAQQEHRLLLEPELLRIIEAILNPAAPAPAPATPLEAAAQLQPGEQAERMLFLRLMDRWIGTQEQKVNPKTGRRLTKSTITMLRSIRNRFADYAGVRGVELTLMGMNEAFYEDFYSYFIEENGWDTSTLSEYITKLKSFLTWCEDQELPVNRKYRKFPAHTKEPNVKPLTEEELHTIEELDFADPAIRSQLLAMRGQQPWTLKKRVAMLSDAKYLAHVSLARDKFLLCAYTALRISDADRVSWKHVDGSIIEIETLKTHVRCYIPFYDDELLKPVALASRYREHPRGRGLLVPRCPGEVNDFLQAVQQLAGITRLHLTTRIARKTYVTAKLYQGVPARSIMQATGHKTEESFNHYVGVDVQRLVEQFKAHAPQPRQRVA